MAKRKKADMADHDRDDLLKMHSYKDAIRRTAGAYVLYPGAGVYKRKGFHELIPGLGAFAIRPSRTDSGRDELKRFLNDVVAHFQNRASQREKVAFRNFTIYNERSADELREPLPEAVGKNRDLIPDDTFVLVGYYKNDSHLTWIRKHNLYNFRTGARAGSLALGVREVNARYLLLHGPGETVSGMLFKVRSPAPRLFSKQDLLQKGYPAPSRELYLVYETDPEVEPEFLQMRWDVTRLPGYRANRASGLPFSVSLTELMKALVK
ncbi:nuclease domain-containing protein [Dyadobacter sp. 676]|uniref:Nuclease domain-containing protein n=1 Tax=Dyadobacter sp. 676 TaxID=3088362 RepID=A0AAU8FCE9_9BACT